MLKKINIFRRLYLFSQWKWRDKLLFIEVLLWLLLAKVFLRFIPFQYFRSLLGQPNKGNNHAPLLAEHSSVKLKKIRFFFSLAGKQFNCFTNCYAQAIAAKQLMRIRGWQTSLQIGVYQCPTGKLPGHAWLSCGDLVITGDHQLERYQVIAQFA